MLRLVQMKAVLASPWCLEAAERPTSPSTSWVILLPSGRQGHPWGLGIYFVATVLSLGSWVFLPASCFHPKGPGQALAAYILQKSQCVYKVISSFSKSFTHMVKISNRLKVFYLKNSSSVLYPSISPSYFLYLLEPYDIYHPVSLMAWHAAS